MNYNDLEQLKKQLAFIEETVGTDWLENWVHSIRDDYGRAYNSTPPLAVSWLKAHDELAMAELLGSFTPDESTLRLSRLAADLAALQNTAGINKILNRLKGSVDEFSTACYQLSIAVGYRNMSKQVSLCDSTLPFDIIIRLSAADFPVVTLAPVVHTAAEVIQSAKAKLLEGIKKLNGNHGLIYLDLPLPTKDAPQQFLETVSEELLYKYNLPNNNYLIITTTFVESSCGNQKLKRSFKPINLPADADFYYPSW